ncbi:hypothetical protein ACJ72_06868 [Emergomyces africanus]|uniref:Uncharacterized protein n=1 Tax=Emergomyces africanus TaxID=1955775 RepID=A0A1B7NPV6_9EURO|nr:hypothetical protein ACJ72_06868 [Emergomyces africanus]
MNQMSDKDAWCPTTPPLIQLSKSFNCGVEDKQALHRLANKPGESPRYPIRNGPKRQRLKNKGAGAALPVRCWSTSDRHSDAMMSWQSMVSSTSGEDSYNMFQKWKMHATRIQRGFRCPQIRTIISRIETLKQGGNQP